MSDLQLDVGIKGLQQAQAANLRMVAALRPDGARGQAVRDATAALHRYAVAITHVWRYKGGGLRASHRMAFTDRGETGRIYIDEGAVNPRGERPGEYGPVEHARGGSHAFYQRTIDEAGPRIADQAVAFISRALGF